MCQVLLLDPAVYSSLFWLDNPVRFHLTKSIWFIGLIVALVVQDFTCLKIVRFLKTDSMQVMTRNSLKLYAFPISLRWMITSKQRWRSASKQNFKHTKSHARNFLSQETNLLQTFLEKTQSTTFSIASNKRWQLSNFNVKVVLMTRS